MARLGQLKLSMTVAVLLVSIIFALFLGAIVFFVQLYLDLFSWYYSVILVIAVTVAFVLFQFLIS
jgi:hypothetical protein